MSDSDLLTDDDLITRHEPKPGWFNQFVCIGASDAEHSGLYCSDCLSLLASKPGDVFFSCCPKIFDTYEEALNNICEKDINTGAHIADYQGTFKL